MTIAREFGITSALAGYGLWQGVPAVGDNRSPNEGVWGEENLVLQEWMQIGWNEAVSGFYSFLLSK